MPATTQFSMDWVDARMGDGAPLERMGGFHRHPQLVDRVGRQVRDATAGAPAGRDDLDDVGALGDQTRTSRRISSSESATLPHRGGARDCA